MSHDRFETLSEAVNSCTKEGYTESFRTVDNFIQSTDTKKEYQPNELKIVKSFRFDGMTNPDDESAVFAIDASDGSKGTLVMSYSSAHNHDVELIRDIPSTK